VDVKAVDVEERIDWRRGVRRRNSGDIWWWAIVRRSMVMAEEMRKREREKVKVCSGCR
jgi:hypothetical protein